jgi:transposase
MVQVGRTIRAHADGILRWFESRISNGILEGINSMIQAAKAKARAYRSNRNLITMAYLIAGRLRLTPLPT